MGFLDESDVQCCQQIDERAFERVQVGESTVQILSNLSLERLSIGISQVYLYLDHGWLHMLHLLLLLRKGVANVYVNDEKETLNDLWILGCKQLEILTTTLINATTITIIIIIIIINITIYKGF